jgi:hypothetical protein
MDLGAGIEELLSDWQPKDLHFTVYNLGSKN